NRLSSGWSHCVYPEPFSNSCFVFRNETSVAQTWRTSQAMRHSIVLVHPVSRRGCCQHVRAVPTRTSVHLELLKHLTQ
ncbi:hypothetical protein DPEC_G00377980, partial [Dallia pectoralis]